MHWTKYPVHRGSRIHSLQTYALSDTNSAMTFQRSLNSCSVAFQARDPRVSAAAHPSRSARKVRWSRRCLRCRKPCLVSSIRLRNHHVCVGAWPNVWFPNLPGSGTAQPPACRAQKFSARSTGHMRALTHGTIPRHMPRPRRKVLRSLKRADLGAIWRIC